MEVLNDDIYNEIIFLYRKGEEEVNNSNFNLY